MTKVVPPPKAVPVRSMNGALVHLALANLNATPNYQPVTLCGQQVVGRLDGGPSRHRDNRCAFCFRRVDPYGYPIGWLGKEFVTQAK